MEEEHTRHLSHIPSDRVDRIADEKGKTIEEREADRSAEARCANDVDTDMDLGEGASNPAPVEPSGSDTAPSENKPKPRSAFVKIMELKEKEMLTAYLEAFFDHFHYYKASGGELHGGISLDTIIYLEEPKKGGLLHLDPPIRSRDFNPCPRQRWIPELEYDEDGEVILGSSGGRKRKGSLPVPVDWYINRPGAP